GGYWLALAGDDIAGLPTSIVGSIGVISAGFGFVEALGKLGIERRTTTAGENKIRLDPFAPLKPEDVAWQKTLQTDLHKIFIETVQKRRSEQGTTLPEDGPLFTGDVWLGQAAKENGLIDRIDSLTAFARREDYKLRPFGGRRRSWLSGLVGLDAETRTQSWIDPEAALDALETRLEDRIRRQALGQ
ncbi:MAG: S49 family peptidase, partial [Rhodospirillaceae bacterium]